MHCSRALVLALLALTMAFMSPRLLGQTPTIDVQFATGTTYTGAAVIGSGGDVWNKLSAANGGPTALNNVGGASSGASITWSSSRLFFGATSYANLMRCYLVALQPSASGTITFAGLTPNASYSLYVYTQGDSATAGRRLTVTPAIGSAVTSTAAVAAQSTFVAGQNYLQAAATTDGSGNLAFTYASAASGLEANVNAIQLAPLGSPPPAAVPTLTTFGGILLACGLAWFGVRTVRRVA